VDIDYHSNRHWRAKGRPYDEHEDKPEVGEEKDTPEINHDQGLDTPLQEIEPHEEEEKRKRQHHIDPRDREDKIRRQEEDKDPTVH